MNDLDLLYDYFKDNDLAASGYAVTANRTKDDKLEKLFANLTMSALQDSKEISKLIIQLGGEIM